MPALPLNPNSRGLADAGFAYASRFRITTDGRNFTRTQDTTLVQTGTLSDVGDITKHQSIHWVIIKTGTLSDVVGAITKQAQATKTATETFAGLIQNAIQQARTGLLESLSTHHKAVVIPKAGELTSTTSTLASAVKRIFATSITLTNGATKQLMRAFDATLEFIGVPVKQAQLVKTAALDTAAVITRMAQKVFTQTQFMWSGVTKQAQVVKDGTVNSSAAHTQLNLLMRAFDATLEFIGVPEKLSVIIINRTLTLIGTPFNLTDKKIIAATLFFAMSIQRFIALIQSTIYGGWVGAGIKQAQLVKTAALDTAAVITRMAQKVFTQTQFMWNGVTKFITKSVTATFTSAANTLKTGMKWLLATQNFARLSISPYAAQVKADGATAHWRMNDTSGNTFIDVIGGYTAVSASNTGITTGVTGALADGDKAVALNGSTNPRMVIPVDFPVSGNLAWSIEAWVKPHNSTGYGAVITDGFARGVFWVEAEKKFTFYAPGNDHFSSQLAVDVLYHVVVTYSNPVPDLLQFYINGAPDTSFTFTGGLHNEDAPGFANGYIWDTLGCDISAERLGASIFDEVAAYNGITLSAAQVAQHYALRTATLQAAPLSVTKQAQLVKTAIVTSTMSMVHAIAKTLAAVGSSLAAKLKYVQQASTASSTFVGTILTSHRVVQVCLAALSFSGTTRKQSARVLSGMLSSLGALRRLLQHVIASTWVPLAARVSDIFLVKQASVLLVGTPQRIVGLVVSVVSTAGTSMFTGTIIKRGLFVLSDVFTLVGRVFGRRYRLRKLIVPIDASLTATTVIPCSTTKIR